MKLAISNIAWQKKDDETIYNLMHDYGFTGLEIAPSRISENPLEMNQSLITNLLNKLNSYNISIVSLQSLHYGKPDLQLFQHKESRNNLLNHTKKCVDLAEKLGAGALVFGSPKNRIRDQLNINEANKIASDFFYELAEYSKMHNTCLCLEPNPKDYGTDYINTSQEALQFVKNIDHPGLKLNIDTGAMTMNHENYEQTLHDALPFAGHFHISEPMLELVSGTKDNSHHEIISSTLKKVQYEGWLSIEMKSGLNPSDIDSVSKGIKFVISNYKFNSF